MSKIRSIILSITIIGLFLGLWAFWWEPSSLQSKNHTIQLPNWPKQCNGLKVALLADLHVGSPHYGIEQLEQVITATQKLNPDLILLAGDFVIQGVVGGKFVDPVEATARLSKLTSPLGTYAVLGNHDWWHGEKIMHQAFEKANIPLLEDASTLLKWKACEFQLVGISDFWEGQHDVRKALANTRKDLPIIAFTHNPDVIYDIPTHVAITFAGHTHGGQVNFPLVGRPIVPSQYGDKLAIGYIQDQGHRLFVNPGLGTSIIPVRFRVPPEISLIILKPQN